MVRGYGNARIENAVGATMNLESGAWLLNQGAAEVRNSGTLARTSGTEEMLVSFAIDNEGAVEVRSGVLTFQGGTVGVESSPGAWRADPGAVVQFSDRTYRLGPAAPFAGAISIHQATVEAGSVVGADSIYVTGTLRLTDPIATSTIPRLTVATWGVLDSASNVSVTTAFNVSGAQTTLRGPGTTTIEQGATGSVNPGAGNSVSIDSHTLRNLGTLTVSAGSVRGLNDTLLHNEGVLRTNADGGGLDADTAEAATLVNDGLVVKDTGSGTTSIGFVVIGDGYLVEESGTLALTGEWNSDVSVVRGAAINPALSLSLEDGGTTAYWDGEGAADIGVHAAGEAGIETLTVTTSDGQWVADADPDCASQCPAEWDTTLAIPASAMTSTAEGARTGFRLMATSVSGRPALLNFSVIVDRTAPAAPTGFEASFDPETGNTYLDWEPGPDPALANGEAGSGDADEGYRYQRPDGSWSDWTVRSAADDAVVSGFQVNNVVAIEHYTRDTAGNRSPTTSSSATVTLVAETSEGVSFEETDAEEPPEQPASTQGADISSPSALASASSDDGSASTSAFETGNPAKCKVKRAVPQLIDIQTRKRLEPNTKIRVKTYMYCEGTDADWNIPLVGTAFRGMRFEVRILKKGRDGDFHLQHAAKPKRSKKRSPAIHQTVDILCRPGTAEYRAEVTTYVNIRKPFSDIRKRHRWDSEPLNCNEAGAWRVQAEMAPRYPSYGLALNLAAAGDPRPATGFQAHHIVPAGETRYNDAERAEAIAYGCGISPNSTRNGIWLRGYSLRYGTKAYFRLSPALQRRQYHPGMQNSARHYEWLAAKLEPALTFDDSSNPWDCDKDRAESILREIKAIEADGDAPV